MLLPILKNSCLALLFLLSAGPLQAQKTQKKKGSPAPAQITAVKEEPMRIVSCDVLENGDTLNALDQWHRRQGMWLIEHAAHYGEPAFVEYGPFQSDIRNGIWKTYSDQGVLQASETYRNGLKDGEGRYFEDGHLICLGHYLGLNAKKLYDTVMVEDAHTNQLKPVRIKTDVGSVRHGLWVYYDIRTGRMKRSEEYQGDELVSEHDYTTLTARDSLYIDQKMQQLPHRSRQEQADIIPVPSSKQKRIRYTEFPDDIPYVTPNVRKK